MKRHGNLWAEIVSMDTLRNAHSVAKKGKGHYISVREVEKDVEGHLRRLQKDLIEKKFTTGKYEVEDRMEGGKMRTIYKLPYYPDRIVQHALMAHVGPIFRRTFIRDTYQSLPSRGTSDARRRIQKMMKSDPQRYAIKMDIKKYYPNVDNEKLKTIIRKKIKCPDTLELIDNIIDSMPGLPIGNLTSQYFGNVFLSEFDWWVKQDLTVKYYYRYCDDLVLFGNDSRILKRQFYAIQKYLNDLGLEIKHTWQLIDLNRQGVDFVGYVFSPAGTRLRKSIAVRFEKHSARSRMCKIPPKRALDGLAAYKGWMMRGNAKRLWRKNITRRLATYCNDIYKTNPLKGRI